MYYALNTQTTKVTNTHTTQNTILEQHITDTAELRQTTKHTQHRQHNTHTQQKKG